MAPVIERPSPPYRQIADDIAARIRSGEYSEGSSIPSARQIASDWGVALATATKVHGELRARGLVRALPGVGTVVSTHDSSHGAQQRGVLTRTSGRVYGTGEVAEIVAADLVSAADDIATALGVEAGSKVVRRERVTRLDGVALSESVSWFAGDLAASVPELLARDRVKAGTFALVAERTGRALASGREEVAASVADAGQAKRLGVGVGDPVLLSRNWFRDQDDGVIEYGESTRRANRWSSHDFQLD